MEYFRKMAAIVALILILIVVMFVTACSSTRTLVSTDSLRITQQGALVTVTDLAGGATYQYKVIRVKRTDAPTEATTATDTATITIVLLPHGGFEITDKAAGRTYAITRNSELFGTNWKGGSE